MGDAVRVSVWSVMSGGVQSVCAVLGGDGSLVTSAGGIG